MRLQNRPARISTLTVDERTTIAEQRQIDPGKLRQLLNGDLDRVVLKAIEKDRDLRYASPQDFAADVERYLNDQPVEAVAPSLSYQLSKYYQRNKTLTRTMLLVIASLAVGLATTTWQWRATERQRLAAVNAGNLADRKTREAQQFAQRTKKAEENATQALRQASIALYGSNLALAQREVDEFNAGEANTILDRCPPVFRGWEWHYMKQRVSPELFKLEGHTSWAYRAIYSPDGRFIASSGGGNPNWMSTGGKSGPGEIIIWDADTGRLVHTLHGHEHVIESIAFSSDSKTLASAQSGFQDSTLEC